MRYYTTNIDQLSLEPERLEVRGKDIRRLIGKIGVVQMFGLVVDGTVLDGAQVVALDSLLIEARLSLGVNHPAFRAVILAKRAGVPPHRAIMAGLAIGFEDIVERFSSKGAEYRFSPELIEGAVYFGVLARLLEIAVHGLETEPVSASTFLQAILAGLQPNSVCVSTKDLKALEAVLVSVQAGFGPFIPSSSLPRYAAVAKASTGLCLLTGLVGAEITLAFGCEKIMDILSEVARTPNFDIDARIMEQRRLNACLPGFGHLLFERDPRVVRLRDYFSEIGFAPPALECFDRLCHAIKEHFGLNPFIDALSAAVFADLSLPIESVSTLLLCMRSSSMIAHAIEARQRSTPTRSDARKAILTAIRSRKAEGDLLSW